MKRIAAGVAGAAVAAAVVCLALLGSAGAATPPYTTGPGAIPDWVVQKVRAAPAFSQVPNGTFGDLYLEAATTYGYLTSVEPYNAANMAAGNRSAFIDSTPVYALYFTGSFVPASAPFGTLVKSWDRAMLLVGPDGTVSSYVIWNSQAISGGPVDDVPFSSVLDG